MSNISSTFACVGCGSAADKSGDFFVCPGCHKKYPIVNGVPDFRLENGYWGNVSREKMRELNSLASRSGDWLGSAKKIIPDYVSHFAPLLRGDVQFLWPTNKDSVILDAGSMWGGITVPAAKYHRDVYALDKTAETLEFLDIRAKQMGLHNIHPVAADLNSRLPFLDGMFDLVILNGVLEWLGVTDEVILEKHWGGRFDKTTEQVRSPDEMQKDALSEMFRVLKPGGALYIGVENRFGIQYFLGMPDDHINVKFVTFLPRAIASFITRIRKGAPYRNYIYSPGQLRKLLRKVGFNRADFFSEFPHYNTVDSVTPFDVFEKVQKPFSAGSNAGLRWRIIAWAWGLLPKRIAKYFSPSLGVLAYKSAKSVKADAPRLLKILGGAGAIESGNPNRYRLSIVNSRQDDRNPAHYVVYDTKVDRNIYFCKVGREESVGTALEREAGMLKFVASLFHGKPMEERIPRLIYISDKGEIPVQATKYISGGSVKWGLWGAIAYAKPERIMAKSKLFYRIIVHTRKFATRRWLKKIDPIMCDAICLLVELQVDSRTNEKIDKNFLCKRVGEQLGLLKSRGALDSSIQEFSSSLVDRLRGLGEFNLPMSIQHGDFDLVNIVDRGGSMKIVDFEHAEKNNLPFFDLANLIFNHLIIQWRCFPIGLSLQEFAMKYGWSGRIKKWVDFYSKESGVQRELLNFLPQLAVLEQNLKTYPPERDPYSYPMYGEESLKEMIKFTI